MALGHPGTALLQHLFHSGRFILQLCMDEILSLLQGQGTFTETPDLGVWIMGCQYPGAIKGAGLTPAAGGPI